MTNELHRRDGATVDWGFGSFRGKAQLYAKYRPQYSKEYKKFLYETLRLSKDSTVADIGAGTGIHTKILAEITDKVFAVEPDGEMLNEFQLQLVNQERIITVQGSAEDTGLPDACVDYVTVAQAFHLFDRKKSLTEFKRILRSSGILVLVWNSKEHDNALFYDNEAVIKKYCPNYCREVHARSFFEDSYKECFTPNSYTFTYLHQDSTEFLDKKTFIMRTLSASYAITPADSNYNTLIEELEIVFDRHAKNGVVIVPQSSVIYSGVIC